MVAETLHHIVVDRKKSPCAKWALKKTIENKMIALNEKKLVRVGGWEVVRVVPKKLMASNEVLLEVGGGGRGESAKWDLEGHPLKRGKGECRSAQEDCRGQKKTTVIVEKLRASSMDIGPENSSIYRRIRAYVKLKHIRL